MARVISFDGADGQRAFRLSLERDVVQVQDAQRKLLATLVLRTESSDAGRPREVLQVQDANGRSLGFIRPIPGKRAGLEVTAPDGRGRRLFALLWERDGDLRLERDNDVLVYKIKKRDYGFKIVDSDGVVESRIRTRLGKTSVRDASGVTYLSTRDPVSEAAVAAFMLRGVPFEIAAGLGVAVAHWEVEAP